jgi:apolipoprotein N-acyltransferase
MMTAITSSQEANKKDMAIRIGIAIALSALSGVMLLLSFPPYGLWPLAWFALVPGVFAQHRLFPARWASLAPALYSGIWLGPFMARLFGSEFGPVFQYLGVLIGILNFFLAKERNFHELTGYRWFILQGVINWVGFEMLRATVIPVVATSAFVGYTQATQAWVIQPVSIFSVYGLNLVIMLVNYALAQGAMAWFDRRWRPADAAPVEGRATRRWLAVTGAILAVWIGISLAILGSAPKDAPTVRVGALRTGYLQPAFLDEVNTDQVRFETIAGQAREAARQGAQILYTSEMVINFDPQEEYTEEFRALAKETGAYMFITYAVAKEGEPWRNEAVLLTPEGEFLGVYGKYHTWGIGESPTPSAGVFPVFDTPLGRLATLICHDANYTDVSRILARNGAQLIGAGFREFRGFGEQLWTNATFRAVETRSSMVVTGAATVAAIIDPYGRQLALDVNRDGSRVTLVGDVPLGSSNTLYLHLGDWLGWISLAGYVFFVVFQTVETRRQKKQAQEQADAAS